MLAFLEEADKMVRGIVTNGVSFQRRLTKKKERWFQAGHYYYYYAGRPASWWSQGEGGGEGQGPGGQLEGGVLEASNTW